MPLFLLNIWNKFSLYIMAIGAILLAIIGIYEKGKGVGKNEVQLDMFKDQAKDTKKALEVSHSVDIIADDDVNKRLQSFTKHNH